jgi:type I restriction enzyme M protein
MSLSNTVKTIQDIMRKDAGVDGDAQRIGQLGWMLFLKIYSDLELETELEDTKYKSPIPKKFRWESWADESVAGKDSLTGDVLINFINNELFLKLKELDLSSFTGQARERGALLISVFDDAYNYMKNGTLLRQVINKINQDIDYNSVETRHLFGDIYEQILRDLQNAGNAGEYYTPRAVTQFAIEMVNPQLGEIVLDPACGTGGFLTGAFEHMKKQVKKPAELKALKNSIRGVEKKPLPHVLCATNMMVHGIEVPSNIINDNTLAKPLRDYGKSDQVDVIITNPPFGGVEEDGIESNFPAEFRTKETADLFLVLVMELLKDGGRSAIVLPDGTLFGEGVKTKIKKKMLEECNLHTIVRLPKSVFAPYTSITTNILFLTKGEPTEKIWYYEHKLPEGYKAYSKTKPMRISEFQEIRNWWINRSENEQAWLVDKSEIVKRNFNLDIKNPNAPTEVHLDSATIYDKYTNSIAELEDIQGKLVRYLDSTVQKSDEDKLSKEQLQLFLSRNSAVSHLRKYILELAVSGKLHSSKRWEASTLEEIAAQPIIDGDWVESKDQDPNGEIRLTQLADIGVGIFKNRSNRFINRETANRLKCTKLEKDDVLIARLPDPIGRACLFPGLDQDCITVVDVAIVKTLRDKVLPEYLVLLFNSPSMNQRILDQSAGTTRQRVATGKLKKLKIEFPVSTNEQQAIVNKVQDLMALCDELEMALAHVDSVLDSFGRAVVAKTFF